MEKITIALNTPLQAFEAIQSIREGITRLEAKLIKQEDSGFLVDIIRMGTDKLWIPKCPFKKIFIPNHKVDHVLYSAE